MVFSFFPLRVFPNETFAFVFSFIFIVFLIIELRVLIRQRIESYKSHDLVFIFVGIFMPLIAIVILSYVGIGIINTQIGYLGFVLMIFAFVLRQYSIYELGKFFVPTVSLQKNHRIIDSGPYRYIRHPSYTGLLLELIGVSLALSNLIGFFIVLVLFVPTVSYRISIEEDFLSKKLKGYTDYCHRTYKLVPFVY